MKPKPKPVRNTDTKKSREKLTGYGWNQREREELGEKGVDVKSQTLLQCTLYPFIVTA